MRQTSFVVFYLIATVVSAQRVEVSYCAGYGIYSMSDIKNFQSDLRKNLIIPAKSVAEFPPYFSSEVKLTYTISRFKTGIFWSLNSTGGRLSYSDYSGSMVINETAKINQVGLTGEFKLSKDITSKWEPFLNFQMGYGKTRFGFSEKINVGNQILANDQLDFESKHVTLNPGIGLKRSLYKRIMVGFKLGYLIDIGGHLELSKDKNYYLVNKNSDPIGVDWSGFRIGIITGILL